MGRTAGLAAARAVLRSYGYLRCRLSPVRGAPMVKIVTVSLTMRPDTASRKLQPLIALCPPYQVRVCRVRRYTCRADGKTYRLKDSWRLMTRAAWAGAGVDRLLAAVGWKTGSPIFDAKAEKLRRWLDYRKASGAYVPAARRPHP